MPLAPADPSLALAARDCLAGQFALAIASEQSAVIEVLQHQLDDSRNRDKWRPLHDALETMRALKPHLREKLDAAIRKRFDAKLSPEPDLFSKTAKFSAASLTLVSEDEVQEEIAVGNTTRRLREATGDELYALNVRLAAALGVGQIADERSPAHPRVFARALLDVIAELSPDTAARLAAFAAHDPVMLQALAAAFRDGNALLVARGVLPEFRRSYGAPQQVAGVHVVTPGAPAAPLATATVAAAKPPEPTPLLAPEAKSLFDRLLANAAVPEALVNEIVDGAFARLVADPHIADSARGLLGRLQPLARRAALTDRHFFTDPGHPIRGLIDAISELGAAGVAKHHVEGSLPEEWISTEVLALVDGGRFDTVSVVAARDRLANLAQRHHEVLVEDDAVVRSVRRDEEARVAVQDSALEIAHRLSSADVTQAAANFVYATWRPVLVHAHHTAGEASVQWKADLATLDDLLWTLTPRASAEERERLEKLVPSVRDRVWQGLIRARRPPGEIESRLDELDRLNAELRRSPGAVAGAITTTAGLGQEIQDDVTATLHISSGEFVDEGLARGAWFEFTQEDGSHVRVRLNWLSPSQGACVFKSPALNRSFAISLADLRAKRDSGLARPVDGPGVALACIEASLADIARDRGIDPGAEHAP